MQQQIFQTCRQSGASAGQTDVEYYSPFPELRQIRSMKQLMYFYPERGPWDHFCYKTGEWDVNKTNPRVKDREAWWWKDAPRMEQLRRRKDAERERMRERGSKLKDGARTLASVWDLLYMSKGQMTGLMPGCKEVDKEEVRKKAAAAKTPAKKKQGRPKGSVRKRKSTGNAEAKKPKRAYKGEGKISKRDGGASVNKKTSNASKVSVAFEKTTSVVKKIIAAKRKTCDAVIKTAVKKCKSTSSKEKDARKGNSVGENKMFPKSKKVTTEKKSATSSNKAASIAEKKLQTKENIESVKNFDRVKSVDSETTSKDQNVEPGETELPQKYQKTASLPSQNAPEFYSMKAPELVLTEMPGHKATLDETNEAAERNPRDWIHDPDMEPVHGGSLFVNMKKSIDAEVSYQCARDKHRELCQFAKLLDPSKHPRWKFVWLKDCLATPGERSQRRRFFQMFSRKHMEVEKYAIASS